MSALRPLSRRIWTCYATAGLALALAATARPAQAPQFQLAHALGNPTAIEGDQFGYSVTFVGENALVGARWADLGGTDAGAAYLFDGKTGALIHTLQRPEPAAGDWFGNGVAAVGENLLVGALGEDTDARDAGAAYLFDGKTGEVLRTFRKPEPAEEEWFGAAVAGVGENVLIGAPLADIGAKDAGAAYLFDGKTGALLQTFKNPSPGADDWFGATVAAVGDQVLIGAFLDDAGAKDSGAAYLFDSKTGALLRTFRRTTPAADDWFGVSLASLNGQAAIGAPLDDAGGNDAGAVYVFDLNENWPPARVQAPTPTAGEQFGFAAAMTADQLLIGAPRDASGKAGTTYLLDRATGALIQRLQNAAPANGDLHGTAVAAGPNAVLIGSPGDPSGQDPGGAAVLFTR
jgi:hypothetical protein